MARYLRIYKFSQFHYGCIFSKNVKNYGNMGRVERFTISVEKEFLKKAENLLRSLGYTNRSEFIRDLIREKMVEDEWRKNKEVIGAISIVYPHHQRELPEKLLDIQHRYQNVIISSQHIHMDQINCLEIIAVKGRADEVQGLFNTLKALKGVKHATISTTTTGKEIK